MSQISVYDGEKYCGFIMTGWSCENGVLRDYYTAFASGEPKLKLGNRRPCVDYPKTSAGLEQAKAYVKRRHAEILRLLVPGPSPRQLKLL